MAAAGSLSGVTEHDETLRTLGYERYGALKRTLSPEHGDSLPYTRAKTDLIQELTDRARAGLGLPPVPVWE